MLLADPTQLIYLHQAALPPPHPPVLVYHAAPEFKANSISRATSSHQRSCADSRASCDTSGHVDHPLGGACHLSPCADTQPQWSMGCGKSANLKLLLPGRRAALCPAASVRMNARSTCFRWPAVTSVPQMVTLQSVSRRGAVSCRRTRGTADQTWSQRQFFNACHPA